ncbi:LPXTG cell wall anchor domain-containing protein [Streptomyces sp. R302]|uniref:lytic polysaccharide monooxygenase n=1 Tax=unclassified Streptomyces TaxID=2593676 RepID=UPI00145FC3B6|nr:MULTISPECIES: lytic polysaccharide monooxygenase [unclassified Streptomyces]NML54466.1 LPXTG cell wall anchor domain-containing protein [Streptomyces sp. R301]NML81728.1 LPXTG cell wall anchor domain-containing protein [Streptomyces sp. R302]
MTSRRTVAVAATALVLAGFAAPAFAHGSMTDPVSRVAACYAEGPESPSSAACGAAVAAGGPQALYDWNGVNIANAAGQHRALIPDGRLCSAGNEKYKGLDLARADWPASKLAAGKHTFRYKGTAPHRGTFALYVTKDGYDPSKPLKWSDLEAEPFLTVTDPAMRDGDYVFEGTVPERSGRHLIYSVWQRSDSPEAFYTCSDVVFGAEQQNGGGGTAPTTPATSAPATTAPVTTAPAASAPSDEQIEEGREHSTVEHGGHGDADASTGPEPKATTEAAPAPVPAGEAVELAETGGDGSTPYLALGGAGVLAVGAAVLFAGRRTRRG